MESFTQLGEGAKGPGDDNEKAGLKLKKFKTADRDIAGRFVDMINRLERHIVESIDELEVNEI